MPDYEQTRDLRTSTSTVEPAEWAVPAKSSDASARAQSTEAHELIAPVQTLSDGEIDGAAVRRNAMAGFSGASVSLPFLERIEQSFGRHSLGDVQAFVGGPAASAAKAMRAQAYTSAGKIAFSTAPDLETAAHEAAHVVQQRAGVQLSGGVGRTGDPYERQADAVAAAVVAGRSAEALLDDRAPEARSGRGGALNAPSDAHSVQQKKSKGNDRFEEGTEIWVARSLLGFTYHHSGVYIGDDEVVHVTAEPAQAAKDLLAGDPIVRVRRTSYSKFAEGDSVIKGPHRTTFENETASIRAQALANLPWSYDPLNKNCQHFSSEMVDGTPDSPEADSIKSAFEAILNAPGKMGKAVMKGLKKAGGWIKKAASGLGSKIKGFFS